MWSYILEYENNKNPFDARRDSVLGWKGTAVKSVMESEGILSLGEQLQNRGVKLYDALHVACACFGECDYFLTVDDVLLNKPINEIRVCNPIDFLREVEE